jgi:HlyD family secretion protein
MSKAKVAIRIAIAGIVATSIWYVCMHYVGKDDPNGPVTLYGNVELRQVSLPFNNSERIAEILVDAGDHVKKGQVLARLETGRIAPLLAQAVAQVDAQRQALARMKNGSRPEEIALAKANLDSAEVVTADARKRFDRLMSLSASSGVSKQDLDTAEAAYLEAAAKAVSVRKNYELVLAGPRSEDIAEAAAKLAALEAQSALLHKQFDDAVLTAPTDAVVRTRVMEPGEMASPLKPVFTLAVTSPKWVRTYVSEPQLGRVKPGMKAQVTCDSFPDKPIEGTVGFIASVAEFTPKTLQTEELRTSLVYEVRILIDDPTDELRLGMPVSVLIGK